MLLTNPQGGDLALTCHANRGLLMDPEPGTGLDRRQERLEAFRICRECCNGGDAFKLVCLPLFHTPKIT